MPKKDSIRKRLEKGIKGMQKRVKKAQKFSNKHLVPRYKTLESQLYPYKKKRR